MNPQNPQPLHDSGTASDASSTAADPANPQSTTAQSPPESPPVHETHRISPDERTEALDEVALADVRAWFAGLPSAGKILVLAVGAIALLGAVSAVLKVIAWSIQLILLGAVMFVAYKVFFHQSASPE